MKSQVELMYTLTQAVSLFGTHVYASSIIVYVVEFYQSSDIYKRQEQYICVEFEYSSPWTRSNTFKL